jgi:hypothetical protein
LSGNTLVAQFDINPAEFHLANPGNCLNNRGHLLPARREAGGHAFGRACVLDRVADDREQASFAIESH